MRNRRKFGGGVIRCLKRLWQGTYIVVIMVRTNINKKDIFSTLRALASVKMIVPERRDSTIPGNCLLCQHMGWNEESYLKEGCGIKWPQMPF